MNKSYLLAAGLSLLAAIIRTTDGLSGPLQAASASSLEPLVISFFHLTWHMVTVVFLASSFTLFFLARSEQRLVSVHFGRFLGIVFLLWSALIATVSFIYVWDVATIIPMIVTFAIGILSLIGARNFKSQSGA